MCRIVGFIDFNFNNSYSLEETITSMRDTLIHGEPDKDFLSDRGTNHNKLWLLFVFELWRNKWM
jgi:hypothetical protein